MATIRISICSKSKEVVPANETFVGVLSAKQQAVHGYILLLNLWQQLLP